MTAQTDRIQESTPASINSKIEQDLRNTIRDYANRDKNAISKRIKELEEEWNIDRVLLTNAASLAGLGLILGVSVHRKWLVLPGLVFSFLLQHGLQGWCPPLPLFRKMGVRSFKEIDRERFALKYLRGDFSAVGGQGNRPNPDHLFEAVSR